MIDVLIYGTFLLHIIEMNQIFLYRENFIDHT